MQAAEKISITVMPEMLRLIREGVISYMVRNDCVEISNIFYGGRDYDIFHLGTSPEDEDLGDDV